MEITKAVSGENMKHDEDKITFISKHPQSDFESLLLLTPAKAKTCTGCFPKPLHSNMHHHNPFLQIIFYAHV
jgi:hypothetical protein